MRMMVGPEVSLASEASVIKDLETGASSASPRAPGYTHTNLVCERDPRVRNDLKSYSLALVATRFVCVCGL